jgi:hypothetical protein
MSAPTVSSRSFGLARAGHVKTPGRDAVRVKGWWLAHRFLVLRRLMQFAILALFLLGPLAGVWVVKGNLSSSLTLGVRAADRPVCARADAGHAPPASEPARCRRGHRRSLFSAGSAGGCSAAGCARSMSSPTRPPGCAAG